MSRIRYTKTDGSLISNPPTDTAVTFVDLDGKFKLKKPDGTIIDFEGSSGVRTKIDKSSSFTPVTNEINGIYSYTASGASTVTLPSGLPVGFFAECINIGTGKLTFEAGVGVTLLTPNLDNTSLNSQYSKAYFYKQSATEWVLLGDLETSSVPLSLSGCQGWYDFGDDTTYTFSSGDIVSQIDDKSGFDRHAIQSTVMLQAERIPGGLNGLSTLRFLGGQRYPINAVATACNDFDSDFTMFAVAKQNSAVNAVVVCSEDSGNPSDANTGFTYNSGSNELRFYMKSSNSIEGNLPSRSTWARFVLRRNGVDGMYSSATLTNQNVNIGGTASQNLTIGALSAGALPLNGEIAEIIIYNRALSNSERDIIRSYLADKWGAL